MTSTYKGHFALAKIRITQEMDITLRSIRPEDEDVLFELFCSAHLHKFTSLGLPEPQLQQLLRIQFEGQRRDFLRNNPNTDFNLVEDSGKVIGQWFVCRYPESIVVLDITFLPSHRTGIATRLVRALLKEACMNGIPVKAHVEATNPARRLWLRLGFRKVGENAAYWSLEYRPD